MDAELLRQTSLIIIDEITMQHRHAAEAVDRLMQDIKGSDRLFGGVTVVFGGDFQHILPVIIKGSRPQIVGACIQQSRIWDNLPILNLTINERMTLQRGSLQGGSLMLVMGYTQMQMATSQSHFISIVHRTQWCYRVYHKDETVSEVLGRSDRKMIKEILYKA
jgi:hypothetical protein